MQDLYKKVWPFIESKQIKPVIHEVLNISETEKAHQIMEDNRNIGKIILSLD